MASARISRTPNDMGQRGQQPQQPIEDEAVDDVGGRVPVGDVLGVLRAHHHAMPELHIAAFADGLAAHGEQNGRLQGEDADAGKEDLAAGELHWPRI